MRIKVITFIMLALLIIFPAQAFAAEEQQVSEEAGITPDSSLYILDRMVENVQLSLTFSPIKKADLLDAIASERLAESTTMLEKDKIDLVKQALEDYQAALDKVSESLDKAINEGENTIDVIEKVASRVEREQERVAKIIDKLDEGKKQNLVKKLEKSLIKIADTKEAKDLVGGIQTTTSTVSSLKQEITGQKLSPDSLKTQFPNLNEAIISTITSKNLNTRQTLALASLAEQAIESKTKSFEEIESILDGSAASGIGSVAKALGLESADALKVVNKAFKETKSTIQDDFKSKQEEQKNDSQVQKSEKSEKNQQDIRKEPSKASQDNVNKKKESKDNKGKNK